MTIRSCKTKSTERFLAGERVKEFQGFSQAAAKALSKIDAADRLGDLRNPPSNRFEALHGNRRGQYSIRINDKYRVCFTWTPRDADADGIDPLMVKGDADNVEITDYH